MLNEICFFSHFGNGDLFNSREIIKDIIGTYPEYKYYYAHAKSRELFCDIPELEIASIPGFLKADMQYLLGNKDDLYINTWIGRDSKYVLPGIGCTLSKYIEMFNETFSNAKVNIRVQGTAKDYLPTIQFDLLKKYDQIKKTMEDLEGTFDNIALISTGDVWSNQAVNFDMELVAVLLAKKYPRILFITTTPLKGKRNLKYSGDITRVQSDLMQIAYISTFCKYIIGRSSGPYVFTQIKENLMTPEVVYISFTNHVNSSQLAPDVKTASTKLWYPETTVDGALERIIEQLG